MINDAMELMILFGERYIYCNDEQALFDAKHNRERMISAFNGVCENLKNAINNGLISIENRIIMDSKEGENND